MLKMLKRHLMTAYGMTFQQYPAKWELQARLPDGRAGPMPPSGRSSQRRSAWEEKRPVEAPPPPKTRKARSKAAR